MSLFDRAIDHAVAFLTGIPKMYYEGWGDPDLLDRLVDYSRDLGPPADIEVQWTGGKQRRDGSHLFEGWFTSPAHSLPLPPESRAAYFQMLLPPQPFSRPFPSMCVHLAGTGDATFLGRRLLANALLEQGIGAIILQNPFYGPRRPHWQRGTRLRTMTDQLMMNLATVEETRSLLKWLRGEGFERVGVTGYSMGGFMAGFAAQTVPFAVAAIPCAAGDTAVAPLIDSPLRNICDWEVLAEEAGGPDHAEMLMRQTLSALALSEHGTPVAPEAGIILGAVDDEFVPPSEPVELHKHWHGSELRWIKGGHTTGWLLNADAIRQAIRDAFARLDEVLKAFR
jgi:dienelactone hydrolase